MSRTLGAPSATAQPIFHRSSQSSSSRSDCAASQTGTENTYFSGGNRDNRRSRSRSRSRSRRGGGGGGDKINWMGHVKNWLSVSEPSAQAMKMQKRDTFKRHGVDPKDPEAAAKMHLPLGTLPRNVTTSTSGPTPEKRLAKDLESRAQYSKHGSSQSVSSGSSLDAPSIREMNHIAPWEN